MITDNQRREVASALRGDPNDTLIPQSRDGFEGMTYHEAAFRFWNMCRRVRSASNVDIAYSTTSVLADLIDRQSTTRHGKFKTKYGRETPCCEVCGYSIGDMRWNYCPKCGAVISDG